MDIKIMRCQSDTTKGIVLTEDGIKVADKWRCKIGQLYIAPSEMPRHGNVILVKAEYIKKKVIMSRPIIEISADIVRKCFRDVEMRGDG